MKTFVFKLCNTVLALVSFIFIALVAIPDKKDQWVGKALLPFGITIPLFHNRFGDDIFVWSNMSLSSVIKTRPFFDVACGGYQKLMSRTR